MTDRYHDGRHLAENPRWHAEDAPLKADAVLRMLATVGWTPASVVDVGCGTGDVLRTLRARLGAQTTLDGWETSADATRLWHDSPGVSMHHGDPFAQGASAELVLALDVAEHLDDDVGFLSALGQVAPRAIVRLPLDDSWLDTLRPVRKQAARVRYGHLHAYTRRLALSRLVDAGWTPLATAYDRTSPTLDTPRQHLMDALRRLGMRALPHLTVDLLGGWSLTVAATRTLPSTVVDHTPKPV